MKKLKPSHPGSNLQIFENPEANLWDLADFPHLLIDYINFKVAN